MTFDGIEIAYTAAMLLLAAAMLLLARVAYAKLAAYDVDQQLAVADNPAVGASLFGFMTGVVIVLAGILSTETQEEGLDGLGWDVFETALYGIVAILLLRVSGIVNDRFILHNCENTKELVEDRNVGVGALLCGSYVASGLVLAGAFSGRLGPEVLPEDASKWVILAIELGTACAFFVIAQLALVIYGQIYQRLTKHDPLEAIEKDYVVDGVKHGGNAAAGMAMGGNLIAVGVVLWGASRGDISDWGDAYARFGIVIGVGLLLLPLWRILVEKVILGKLNVNHEIYVDRNPNAALLESIALVGFAVVIALMLGPDAVAAVAE